MASTSDKVNLVSLIEKYGSEEKCRAYLEELRWPNGPVCPRCECESVSRIAERNQFDCNSCRYQFSVTAGTLFHDSHLPLWKWFLGIYLIAESKKGISAKQLQRMLKVSYKTAWYMGHRIREAMGDDDQPLLRGIIEADETFLGGKYKGRFYSPKEAADHRMDNKAIVVGAVQRHGEVRLRLVKDTKYPTLLGFMADVVADEAEAIYTDSNRSYRRVGDENTRHEFVNHKADEWVRGDVHTQTIESVWSLLDRSIMGAFHKISVKHLPRYLDEIEFRFNGRENPFLFRDTLLVLLHGQPMPYRQLVGGTAA